MSHNKYIDFSINILFLVKTEQEEERQKIIMIKNNKRYRNKITK